jgi:hypothetical protein
MEDVQKLLDEQYKYKKADREELNNLCSEFLGNCHELGLAKDSSGQFSIGASMGAIMKIIEQVRRRRLYFHIYHDTMGLNEIKETALHVFWMLKLQPFYWKDGMRIIDGRSYVLNAKLALNFFLKGLDLYANEMTKNAQKKGYSQKYRVNINANIIRDLYYSFCFQDLSKESLMAMAECLIIIDP